MADRYMKEVVSVTARQDLSPPTCQKGSYQKEAITGLGSPHPDARAAEKGPLRAAGGSASGCSLIENCREAPQKPKQNHRMVQQFHLGEVVLQQ